MPVLAVEPNWIMVPEKPLAAWMVVPGVRLLEGMPSPSPISRVLFGKTHPEPDGITIGVVAPVAGSRMVDGGGLVIPAHGLAKQVMFVLEELRPRASMTAPAAG